MTPYFLHFLQYHSQRTATAEINPYAITILLCVCILIATPKAIRAYLEWLDRKPGKVIPLSQTVDNINTRPVAIVREINKVEDEEKLYKTLALIKRYECDYPDDYNAQREAEGLREVWNAKARKIYGIEEEEAPELENNSLVKAR